MRQDITTLDQRLARLRIYIEESDYNAYRVVRDTILEDLVTDIEDGEFDNDLALLKKMAQKIRMGEV